MARRRKEKSLAEALAGFVMMITVFAILSPGFRGLIFTALSELILFSLLLGLVVLIVYLAVLFWKNKAVPVKTMQRNATITRSASRPFTADFPSSSKIEDITIYPTDRDPDSSRLTIQSPKTDVPQLTPVKKARYPEVVQLIQPLIYVKNTPPRHVNWGDSVLSDIEWKRFEVVTKEFLKMTGYEAHETNVGADGGVDIRVTKPAVEGFMGIVQCKAWNTYKVGVKPVRELFGVMAAEKINTGMLITSGNFSLDAEDFAKGRMTLISGSRFLELIRKLPEEKQRKLHDIALDGDYRTPTCPQCDIKILFGRARKAGIMAGSSGGVFGILDAGRRLYIKNWDNFQSESISLKDYPLVSNR